MLRAIPVPCQHGKYDRVLYPARARGGHQARNELGVVRHLGSTPQFEPARIGVVHQKQKRALVLGEMTYADELLVAGVVQERQRMVIEYLEKARWTAAVLHIRLTIGTRRCQIGRVALGDERHHIRGKLARKA